MNVVHNVVLSLFEEAGEDRDWKFVVNLHGYHAEVATLAKSVATYKPIKAEAAETLTAETVAKAFCQDEAWEWNRKHRGFAPDPSVRTGLHRAMNGLLGNDQEDVNRIRATQIFQISRLNSNRLEPRKSDFGGDSESCSMRRFGGYNGKVRRFPGVFWAGMFGFDQLDFESVEESKAAPSVTFDS